MKMKKKLNLVKKKIKIKTYIKNIELKSISKF